MSTKTLQTLSLVFHVGAFVTACAFFGWQAGLAMAFFELSGIFAVLANRAAYRERFSADIAKAEAMVNEWLNKR